MDERLLRIRESERKSHTDIYMNEELYNTNSWLKKPIKTVQEVALWLEEYNELRVLDLGCGIGRNSIYIAERFKDKKCIVDCVDLLDIAIEKLMQNAREHNVILNINGINKSIEEFKIGSESYDFIMAISALEHIDTEAAFLIKLNEIKNGLRENGIACFVINSNVREMNIDTKEIIDAQFEVNLSTEKLQEYLTSVFNDWDLLKTSVMEQEYDIPRDMFVSHLHTDVVTYVVRKCKKTQLIDM